MSMHIVPHTLVDVQSAIHGRAVMQAFFDWCKVHPGTQRGRDLATSTQDIRNVSEKHLPNPHHLDKNEVC